MGILYSPHGAKETLTMTTVLKMFAISKLRLIGSTLPTYPILLCISRPFNTKY